MSDEQNTPEEEPATEGFIAGRGKLNAQRALAAADEVGVEQWLVRAERGGYRAPIAVVDRYAEMLEAETAAQAELDAAAEAEVEAARAAELEAAHAGQEGSAAPAAPEPAKDDAPAPAAETKDGDVPAEELPEDSPEWTHTRLDEFAGKHEIDLTAGLNKTDKVAAILAALNKEE